MSWKRQLLVLYRSIQFASSPGYLKENMLYFVQNLQFGNLFFLSCKDLCYFFKNSYPTLNPLIKVFKSFFFFHYNWKLFFRLIVFINWRIFMFRLITTKLFLNTPFMLIKNQYTVYQYLHGYIPFNKSKLVYKPFKKLGLRLYLPFISNYQLKGRTILGRRFTLRNQRLRNILSLWFRWAFSRNFKFGRLFLLKLTKLYIPPFWASNVIINELIMLRVCRQTRKLVWFVTNVPYPKMVPPSWIIRWQYVWHKVVKKYFLPIKLFGFSFNKKLPKIVNIDFCLINGGFCRISFISWQLWFLLSKEIPFFLLSKYWMHCENLCPFVNLKYSTLTLYASLNFWSLRNPQRKLNSIRWQKFIYSGLNLHFPRCLYSAPAHYMYPFCYDKKGFVPLEWFWNRYTKNDFVYSHYTAFEGFYPTTFIRYTEYQNYSAKILPIFLKKIKTWNLYDYYSYYGNKHYPLYVTARHRFKKHWLRWWKFYQTNATLMSYWAVIHPIAAQLNPSVQDSWPHLFVVPDFYHYRISSLPRRPEMWFIKPKYFDYWPNVRFYVKTANGVPTYLDIFFSREGAFSNSRQGVSLYWFNYNWFLKLKGWQYLYPVWEDVDFFWNYRKKEFGWWRNTWLYYPSRRYWRIRTDAFLQPKSYYYNYFSHFSIYSNLKRPFYLNYFPEDSRYYLEHYNAFFSEKTANNYYSETHKYLNYMFRDTVFFKFNIDPWNFYYPLFKYSNGVKWETTMASAAKNMFLLQKAVFTNRQTDIPLDRQFNSLFKSAKYLTEHFKYFDPELWAYHNIVTPLRPKKGSVISPYNLEEISFDLSAKAQPLRRYARRLKNRVLYKELRTVSQLFVDSILGGTIHKVYQYDIVFNRYIDYSLNRPSFNYHLYGLYSPTMLMGHYTRLHQGINFVLYFWYYFTYINFLFIVALVLLGWRFVMARFLWKNEDFRYSWVGSW